MCIGWVVYKAKQSLEQLGPLALAQFDSRSHDFANSVTALFVVFMFMNS